MNRTNRYNLWCFYLWIHGDLCNGIMNKKYKKKKKNGNFYNHSATENVKEVEEEEEQIENY